MPLSQKTRDWFAKKAGYPLEHAHKIQQAQQCDKKRDEPQIYIGRGYPAFGQSVDAQEKDSENLALLDKIASSR